MNKDVIYIEPEDDITDIITKIEKSKDKIVALVPPKKAGVFRSVVNIKLIAKSGNAAGKTIVLVTVDPSIVKLAASAKLPVTKDLQTAPVIPKIENEAGTVEKDELVEESDGTVETEKDVDELEGGDKEDEKSKGDDEDNKETEREAEDEDEDEDSTKKKDTKADKAARAKSTGGNKIIAWIKDHKKATIFGGIGVVLLILALVWAFGIAPAVTVTVGIRTTSNNFSENVNFTTKLEEENTETGVFYLEEKKVESTQEVNFEATGSKNVGEKATGEVVVYAFFKQEGSTPINAGSVFTINGLNFVSSKSITLSWDGETFDNCDNKRNATELLQSGCQISSRVAVMAAEPGSNYNIVASTTGWNTTANVAVYSDSAMSGGTDNKVTIVQQSDIDKAKAELAATNEAENKEKLLEKVGDDVLVIDSSFAQTAAEAVATPAVGEEVKEGVKPTLKATTTASIYVVDKTKVEEFITKKANLSSDQKIYEMKNPFVENFLKTDNGFTGKLKTSYITGPKVSETEVADLIKGRGLGDAQHALRDIDGVTSVTIDTSVPWVTSVPGNTNKITVILEVKE